MLVSACMTPDPMTIKTDSTIYDAMQMMLERDIRHLPVVDERGEELFVGEFTTPVRVEDGAFDRLLILQRHQKRFLR